MSKVIKGRNPELALLRSLNDSGIPCDVTFIVRNSDENNEKTSEDGKEIMAHKLILASFSPVFKKMFYGAMKETRDKIPVDETTVDAFNKLVDYFYQVDINCEDLPVQELFDLVNLAERYDVPKLMDELICQMELVPITMKNIMELAAIATEFSVHEATSSALLLACAKHFQKEVTSDQEKVKFMVDQYAKGNGMDALKLLSLVETLPPLKCANCHEKDCLVGKEVPVKNLVEGLKVKMNQKVNWGDLSSHESFEVTTLRSNKHFDLRKVFTQIVVKSRVGGGSGFSPILGNVPTLVYDC